VPNNRSIRHRVCGVSAIDGSSNLIAAHVTIIERVSYLTLVHQPVWRPSASRRWLPEGVDAGRESRVIVAIALSRLRRAAAGLPPRRHLRGLSPCRCEGKWPGVITHVGLNRTLVSVWARILSRPGWSTAFGPRPWLFVAHSFCARFALEKSLLGWSSLPLNYKTV
jgi:hypothetical protein